MQRLTYRRRLSYNTPSNKVRVLKTPGNELRYFYKGKVGKSPRCGDCHKKLQGIPACRPHQYSRMSKTKKRVSRAYGGSRCASCVKDRVMRAFLIEEQKIVKKVLKTQTHAKSKK
ncbi:uncharacterized protein T551_01341 [Pneumocystis jirovecii RU7]|uniref:60S ribosomal protein L34-B n=1 Tax=Pneumocystis jirovecii (strain RU7) TaxID=1408657 RepID=A0A0W4ZSC5_PNEJ7|nr:uncharacterized protein T551_01341 [Pneumocystis jirovecii RU7]KTW31269.1 hypothetical protein T551_01341 [Pneumocystis jirovecii RU7]